MYALCQRHSKSVSKLVLAEDSFDESDLSELDDSDDLSDSFLDPK